MCSWGQQRRRQFLAPTEGAALTPHAEQHQADDARIGALFWVAIAGYLVLAVLHASTKVPHSDEGLFGSTAWLLSREGHLGWPTATHQAASFARGLYAVPPGYALGLWAFTLPLGLSIFTARLFSIFAGLAMLVAWYRIVKLMLPSLPRAADFTILFLHSTTTTSTSRFLAMIQ